MMKRRKKSLITPVLFTGGKLDRSRGEIPNKTVVISRNYGVGKTDKESHDSNFKKNGRTVKKAYKEYTQPIVTSHYTVQTLPQNDGVQVKPR
jgi:hypothetical protein